MANGGAAVLDDSKVQAGHGHAGAVVEHLRFAGVCISRVMHPPGQRIEAHGHDWPGLTLYRMGAYQEIADDGAVLLDGPSIVFQPAGAAHADEIGASGLETLSMIFDPKWLASDVRRLLPDRTHWRSGGALAFAARRLAEVWLAPAVSEAKLREETSNFLLRMAAEHELPNRPNWLRDVDAAIERETRTSAIAQHVDRNPAWLARAYRAWRGEGMGETLRRRRVERATVSLRTSSTPLAELAAECGFCDQSHMNRAFRAVLGRTPLDVRREAPLLAPLMA